jgi:predicted nucleotidyltransferase
MRTNAPALLPILRSQVQGDILALTYLSPDCEFSVTEIARRIGASVKASQHEVARLVTAGFLADRRSGGSRLVRAVTDNPLSRPLSDLITLTYGPLPVLTQELSRVFGVEKAALYGSWAARYQGEAGPPPNDIDVLVIGTADLDDLDDVARRAQARLGREVNIRRVRPDAWRDQATDDAFLESVRSRPLVELDLAHVRGAA